MTDNQAAAQSKHKGDMTLSYSLNYSLNTQCKRDTTVLTGVVIKEPDVPVLVSRDCDWKSRMTHDAVHLTLHWKLYHHDNQKQL